MAGLALTWRNRKEQHVFLIVLVLAVLLPYVAVHVESRYLLPAVPAYFIWIGLGADRLVQRVEHRSHRAARHVPVQPAPTAEIVL